MPHTLPQTLMAALDGLGSFVFALSGGLLAVRKGFDLFGVLLLSFVVAVTGGITRDLLIGAVPPAAVASWHTLAIAAFAGLLTFYVYPAVQSLGRDVLLLDAVWLYFRFPLSLRHVDELLAARGIAISHETVRQWGLKFGQEFANQVRRKLPAAGYKWHLDEVVVKISGVLHYLWRAVDKLGVVLDVLVQGRRDGAAVKRFFKRLLHGLRYKPKRVITDGLPSYSVAPRALPPDARHRTGRYLNNRAENPHQPTRRRERQMHRSKSRAGAGLPVVPCVHLRPLPAAAPSHDGSRPPACPRQDVPNLAARELCPSSGLILWGGQHLPRARFASD